MKIAVIGGGVFGSMTALRLAEAGHRVTVFERQPSLMMGASYNNQNRLHLGFHYPRDDETARQCILGFKRFVDEFSSCILSGFPNAYFIASQGSHTTPENFVAFAERLDLRYTPIDLATFMPQVDNVDMGVLTDEVVYDSVLVRAAITERLSHSNVAIRVGEAVVALHREGDAYRVSTLTGGEVFDAVVNCSYADINRLTASLGHPVEVRQYEYTAVPVVEVDLPSPVGITIMDGRFMTLLPFGKSGRYLLYHVEHAVIARENAPVMNPAWLAPDTSPFTSVDSTAWFDAIRNDCVEFVPAVRDARHVDTLQGPRMVLANRDATDERPSITTQVEPRYVTVFAGKIDHCIWVADKVTAMFAPG